MALDLHRSRFLKRGCAQLHIPHLLVTDEAAVELVYIRADRRKNLGVARAGRKLLHVGEDHGGEHRISAALPADNHALGNLIHRREVFLNLLGEDIFAVFEDNDRLLSAGDVNIPLAVEIAEVTRAEPTVVGEGGSGGRLILVVAEHDVLALDADFAVAVGRDVVKLDLAAGQRNADGGRVVEHIVVGADQRRALGDAVAVDERDADAVKEFAKLGTQRRTAADDLTQIAAERLVHRGKQRLAHVDAHAAHLVAHRNHLFEGLLLAILARVCHNLFVEDFDKGGDKVDEVRLVLLKVLEDKF